MEVSKARGEYVAPVVGRTTIGELGPAWLDRPRGHMKPSGYLTYESMWRTHVAPRWADTRIANIRHSDVQAWAAALAARRGAVTVQLAFLVLSRILDEAVKDQLLASNPARGVKLPKRPPRRNVYLTAAQLDGLADESGRYRSLVLLLGVGGLRWGEAVALRVEDIDFLRRRVELHRNAVKVNGTFVVGSLKSNKNRTVALPMFIIDALAETAKGKGRDDLLWPSRSGGFLAAPKPALGWQVRSGAASRSTRHSHGSRLTRSATRRRRWPFRRARIRRWFSGCSGTPARR